MPRPAIYTEEEKKAVIDNTKHYQNNWKKFKDQKI